VLHPRKIAARAVKRKLEDLEISVSDLADALELTAPAIHKGIEGNSPRVEKAIADALGISPEELWPWRYRRDQTRLVRLDFRTQEGRQAKSQSAAETVAA